MPRNNEATRKNIAEYNAKRSAAAEKRWEKHEKWEDTKMNPAIESAVKDVMVNRARAADKREGFAMRVMWEKAAIRAETMLYVYAVRIMEHRRQKLIASGELLHGV